MTETEKMEEIISKIIIERGIKNAEIHKEAYNGYYVILQDKEIEKEINTEIKKLYFAQILDNKVKSKFKTWGNFNENVEKSYRNKHQIVKYLVYLSELLKEIDLKIELK